jgi:copper chaperone CopZ
MEAIRLDVRGMSCGHCVMHVKKALAGVPGVEVVEVVIGHADVRVADRATALPAIAKALTVSGYELAGPAA